MLDVKPKIIEELSKILPVSYEVFEDSDTSVPCITYIEYMNKDNKTGDTIGYSNIGYTITVWTNSLKDQADYSKLVDKAMRDIGFKRVSSNEMVENNLFRKILDYEGLGFEIY